MAAADDERTDHDAATGRPRSRSDDAPRTAAGDASGTTTNIDRVAHKVKGLLRSDG